MLLWSLDFNHLILNYTILYTKFGCDVCGSSPSQNWSNCTFTTNRWSFKIKQNDNSISPQRSHIMCAMGVIFTRRLWLVVWKIPYGWNANLIRNGIESLLLFHIGYSYCIKKIVLLVYHFIYVSLSRNFDEIKMRMIYLFSSRFIDRSVTYYNREQADRPY